MQEDFDEVLDLVGVGLGPFNLSLNALLDKKDCKSIFLEKKSSFSWFPNLLLKNSKLQINFLKDLVSLIDPTSKYSFLNYLVEHKLINCFLNRNINHINRLEFEHYMKWVANQLNNIQYEFEVDNIDYDKDLFICSSKNNRYRSKNIVMGIGRVPSIPKCCINNLSENVFHVYDYKEKINENTNLLNKDILVVGGGQSGAEIVMDLLDGKCLPKSITWASKRSNFHQLDDSSFVNEFHSPTYLKYFYNKDKDLKNKLISEQVLTSDGISLDLANDIYNKAYNLNFIENLNYKLNLLVSNRLIHITNIQNNKLEVKLKNLVNNQVQIKKVDIVILATGFKSYLPYFLKDFLQIDSFDDIELNIDYSLKNNRFKGKMFLQNISRSSHGVSDSNLSLASYRNAKIINSVFESNIYNIDSYSLLNFNGEVI